MRMEIFLTDVVGVSYQKKFNEIKENLINIGFSDKESVLLSDYILVNKITTNKNNLMLYKNDIKDLIFIVDGLKECKQFLKDNNIELCIKYIYHDKYLNKYLSSVLNIYSDINKNINELYNLYNDMLLLRL